MIAQQIGISEAILKEDVVLADIGLDSMQVAEIVIAIERRARKPLDISDLSDQLDADCSLGQFMHLVEQKLKDDGVSTMPIPND